MRNIIDTIKNISNQPLRVYIGEGMIKELGVSLHNGISLDLINTTCSKLPNDWKKLLQFSNGMEFFNAGDYSIFPLEDIISTQKSFPFEEHVFPVSYVLDDFILLEVNNSDKGYSMYAGPSIVRNEYVYLDDDIQSFFEKFLLHNCEKYWDTYQNNVFFNF